MIINLLGIHVNDQTRALDFYTRVLGFEIKHDIPLGEFRWLTVVSPEQPDGTELVLEPDDHPAAKAYVAALVADGIPVTSFAVDDAVVETERLKALGVVFVQEPLTQGPVTTAILDDTCGNLIQITSMNA